MQKEQMAPKIVQTQRESSSKGSKRPHKFSSYVALMSKIIDVWEVVMRPKGKSVVTSMWIYKTKHVVDGSIQNYKS
jgi:hypothetical protein